VEQSDNDDDDDDDDEDDDNDSSSNTICSEHHVSTIAFLAISRRNTQESIGSICRLPFRYRDPSASKRQRRRNMSYLQQGEWSYTISHSFRDTFLHQLFLSTRLRLYSEVSRRDRRIIASMIMICLRKSPKVPLRERNAGVARLTPRGNRRGISAGVFL